MSRQRWSRRPRSTALVARRGAAHRGRRAGGGHVDRRHDRRRPAADHRQSRPGVRGLSLRRLQSLRFAGAVGPVAGRQGVRHQAGPRHRMACRRGRHQALDLHAAPGRQVARRLPVHRRRCRVEHGVQRRRKGAAVQHRAIRPGAPLSRHLCRGREDRRPHRRVRHQGAGFAVSVRDQLRADDQPVPRQGGQLRLGPVRAAPVGHRPLQIRQDGARTSGWNSCRTPNTGTRRACRSRTGWC